MELHPNQQQAYQEEHQAWIRAHQVDIELWTTQRHDDLTGKKEVIDIQLTKLH
jgi:hypothetical protein